MRYSVWHHNKWRSIKWLSLAIALSSIVLAVVLMRFSGSDQGTPETTTESANTQVESPVIIERKDGVVVWRLRAQDASQQLDGRMLLNQPKLVLYTKQQQKKITITSQQAWFNPLTRSLQFEDKVLVHDGVWSISTDLLRYISANDELHIPHAFKLWGNSISAHGKNMHLHRNSEQVNVDDGISITDSAPRWQGVTR